MGWFPWSKDDPLSEIDPSLRRFIEQQNKSRSSQAPPPAPYLQPQPSSQDATESQTSWRSYLGLSTEKSDYVAQRHASPSRTAQSPTEDTAVPAESLYQDGRYAHLWKNYRPNAAIEEAGKSDQEKLSDVVAGYRDRQAQVKRAALENCANEQMAVHSCFRTGTLSQRMTMCSSENRELQRCILSQTRFLKALGYMGLQQRGGDELDAIQMHADGLWQKQKSQERAVEEAREKGAPLPEFARIDAPSDEPAGSASGSVFKKGPIPFESLPQDVQKRLAEKRFKDLEGFELEMAKREVESEIATQSQLVQSLESRYKQEHEDRMTRREEGRERWSDKIKGALDMRDWSKIDAEREAQRQRALQQEQS